ncbi:MAG: AmmeMemoRadiSam system radical SAM enzyme [Coriobacteriaceae bacterium]|nr:AmmeMemoRadiSam system radical SAM enzyme [Coriobacteriaceae bacterium]
MHEALLWSPEDGRVRCRLCPHACLIADGHEGYCGVRRNVAGKLFALTYGRVSSIAADPIEKKPVFHYFPGTSVLSLGSVGCSMRCGHCQNWTISRAGPEDEAGLHDLPPDLVVDMARKYRCPGVAFTYNEPVIWAEYVLDVAAACREAGLYTVMVTNGYITAEGLDLIGEVIDVWRVDVKGLDDEQYRRLCKVPSAKPVFDMAERAKGKWQMHVEVVTNVVPGINDDVPTLRGIAEWMCRRLGPDTPWHVTRFFPYLDFSDVPATPIETLRRAREIGHEAGLHFVYLGNVGEPGGEDTVCPSCGAVAVARSGYVITERRTRDGACTRCGTGLSIVE